MKYRSSKIHCVKVFKMELGYIWRYDRTIGKRRMPTKIMVAITNRVYRVYDHIPQLGESGNGKNDHSISDT